MTSNNAFQTPNLFDYSTLSPETLRNFDDFKNMFKGIDSDYFTPCDIAFAVLEKIKRMRNQTRTDDAVEWFDNQIYLEIRDTVDEQAVVYAREAGYPVEIDIYYESDSESDSGYIPFDDTEIVSDIED